MERKGKERDKSVLRNADQRTEVFAASVAFAASARETVGAGAAPEVDVSIATAVHTVSECLGDDLCAIYTRSLTSGLASTVLDSTHAGHGSHHVLGTIADSRNSANNASTDSRDAADSTAANGTDTIHDASTDGTDTLGTSLHNACTGIHHALSESLGSTEDALEAALLGCERSLLLGRRVWVEGLHDLAKTHDVVRPTHMNGGAASLITSVGLDRSNLLVACHAAGVGIVWVDGAGTVRRGIVFLYRDGHRNARISMR